MARVSDLTNGCAGGRLELRILRRWTPRYRANEMWFFVVDEHVSFG